MKFKKMEKAESDKSRKEDENEFSIADKSCAVCGDAASGHYYNAYTCQGCKIFFYRTTKCNLELVCLLNFKCKVTKESRSRCKPCRYRACLNAGMKMSENFELDALEKPSPIKKKVSVDSHLIEVALEAHKATFTSSNFISKKKTVTTLSEIEEVGEKGRLWAKQFISMVLDYHVKDYEKNQLTQNAALSDIMILRLAARFIPELRGFLFHSGSLVPLVDLAKSLGRNLCRKLLFVASFFIFMDVDDYELSLLSVILATLKRPTASGLESALTFDDCLRAHLTVLHNYELNKRSWKTNMSYKMLQILLSIRDLSIKEEGRLFAVSQLQEERRSTTQSSTTNNNNPSPEAANILAMELLQSNFAVNQSPSSQNLTINNVWFPNNLQNHYHHLPSNGYFHTFKDPIFLKMTNGPDFLHAQTSVLENHKNYVRDRAFIHDNTQSQPNYLFHSYLHDNYSHSQINHASQNKYVYDNYLDSCSIGLQNDMPNLMEYSSEISSHLRSSPHEFQSSPQNPLPATNCIPLWAENASPYGYNSINTHTQPMNSFTPYMIGQHSAFFHPQ